MLENRVSKIATSRSNYRTSNIDDWNMQFASVFVFKWRIFHSLIAFYGALSCTPTRVGIIKRSERETRYDA